MKKCFLLSLAFTILGFSVNAQTIIASAQNTQYEGGEIKFMESNSNYNPWNIDNYKGILRFYHGASTYFSMHPNGDSFINGNLELAWGLVIAKEQDLPAESSISEGDWGNYILVNNGTTRTLRLGVSNDNYTRGEIEIENNNSASASIFFKTSNASGGASKRMAITGNGDVGIGTTAPDAKLAVKGDIHAQEVKVDLSVPGPDYVFKEGYNLRTLEETQHYIKEHGHLPNIPSAREMEENGVELGVMNMKLLEKIEELVLYTLQQQNQINKNRQLSVEVDELRTQNKKLFQRLKALENK